MNQIRFLQDHLAFSTREFAFLCGPSISAASRKLARLEAEDAITKVTRGVWCQLVHARFSPNQAVRLLLGNERGYVSFLSALHMQGALSQIPAAVQVATTGHRRMLETPIGRYEFHQIKPEMMRSGIEVSETNPPYLRASAEKALLDTLYLGTRKGRRYSSLPELDGSVFDLAKLECLTDALCYPSAIATAISARLARHLPDLRADALRAFRTASRTAA